MLVWWIGYEEDVSGEGGGGKDWKVKLKVEGRVVQIVREKG